MGFTSNECDETFKYNFLDILAASVDQRTCERMCTKEKSFFCFYKRYNNAIIFNKGACNSCSITMETYFF